MKRLVLLAITLLLTSNIFADDHTQYVNPFIGTQTDATGALSGSTFPGACVPFGLVQLCPETEYYVTWDPCSGYDYNKNTIYGITHTHLSGTGCTDLFDVSLMPTTTALTPDFISHYRYSSTFSHEQEGAEPGYYWVNLLTPGVKVELTATAHAGIHCYTFPAGKPKNVVVDLAKMTKDESRRTYRVIQSQMKIVDDHTIVGYRLHTGWAKLRRVYFRVEFSEPFARHTMMDATRNYASTDIANGSDLRLGLEFKGSGGTLMAKVALSTVDSEGADRNFRAEAASWDFNAYRKAAHDQWEKRLAQIDIDGTPEQKRIFYTGLYHNYVQPNIMNDVDGRYVTTTYEVKQLPKGQNYYSTFSLWDTFRATQPLYNLLDPQMTAQLVNAMIIHQQSYGYLPIWDLWGQDNYCMIGNHAMPVLARAVLTGIPGVDPQAALRAMVESSTRSHLNSPFEIWEKYGYMPEPLQTQSVSITLEQAFDDWCVYAVAQKLGRADIADRFYKRSEYYRNLFDPSIGFFAPKDEKGNWIRPFDPYKYGANGDNPFTEGNAWQYMWFVPQNPQGLISLFGSRDKFIKKLDQNFNDSTRPSDINGNASGFIGQYAHGNEPSHHTAYLYTFAGRPDKTQEMVAKIRSKFYNDKPYGYAGNDDCGQMSAWYIFSSLGFYPFNAGSNDFVIGTPLFNNATIHLANGKTFAIRAPHKTDKDIYVRSVKLNGKAIKDWKLTQQQIMNGGTLEFKMSAKR